VVAPARLPGGGGAGGLLSRERHPPIRLAEDGSPPSPRKRGEGAQRSPNAAVHFLFLTFFISDIFYKHPRSLRDVLEANLNVNGERRLRSWFATMIPGGLGGASRRTMTPRARSLPCQGQGGESHRAGQASGAPRPRREPRRRRGGAPQGEAEPRKRVEVGRLLDPQASRVRPTALCSLSFWGSAKSGETMGWRLRENIA
jgi:hypothetical protein